MGSELRAQLLLHSSDHLQCVVATALALSGLESDSASSSDRSSGAIQACGIPLRGNGAANKRNTKKTNTKHIKEAAA